VCTVGRETAARRESVKCGVNRTHSVGGLAYMAVVLVVIKVSLHENVDVFCKGERERILPGTNLMTIVFLERKSSCHVSSRDCGNPEDFSQAQVSAGEKPRQGYRGISRLRYQRLRYTPMFGVRTLLNFTQMASKSRTLISSHPCTRTASRVVLGA